MREESGRLNLEYRRDLNILLCRWLGPVASSEEVREDYHRLLQYTSKLQANLILVDTRQRGYIKPEDEAWIMETFFPAVEQTSANINFYAYLVTPTIFNHIKQDVGFDLLANFRKATKVRVFDSERDAVDWLLSIQQSVY